MRIAIDATPVIHGERAVRRNSRNLIQSLLALDTPGVEYVLFYLDWRGNKPGRIHLPQNGHHREYVCRLPWRIIGRSWNALAWPPIESMLGEVDLLYGLDLHFPPTRNAMTMTTLRRIACVSVPHLCAPDQVRGLRQALSYAMKYSDYFLAVSEYTKKEAVEWLAIDLRRIPVSPHGVDPAMHVIGDRRLVAATLKQRFGIVDPYLLYVGAITHRKNVLSLIKAFMIVHKSHDELHLVLVGAPDNASQEVEILIAEEGLAGCVHWLGSFPTESDDLLYLYNGGRMLVYPTLHEGWTAPPLEAMACGIPVVTSDCSSVPETCGDAAHLVDPNSIQSIAAGILRVMEDRKYRWTLVERGLARARECSWEASAARLEAIFADMVAHGKRWSRQHGQ